jgi:hypothetical protein
VAHQSPPASSCRNQAPAKKKKKEQQQQFLAYATQYQNHKTGTHKNKQSVPDCHQESPVLAIVVHKGGCWSERERHQHRLPVHDDDEEAKKSSSGSRSSSQLWIVPLLAFNTLPSIATLSSSKQQPNGNSIRGATAIF